MSRQSAISSIDLNLLKVMHAIATTGQITAAGDMIGLSQPAISHALKRLRNILDDDLFVRTGNSVQMTGTCAELMPGVRTIIAECEKVFSHTLAFNPASSDLVFRVGMNDYFSVVLMPPLIRRMATTAPGCSLQILHMPRRPGATHSTSRSPVQNALDEGEIDIAMMTGDRFPSRFSCEPLFTEERVFITAASNPLDDDNLTIERILSMGHVKITSDPGRRGWIDEKLDTLKRKRRVVATVPHFSAAVAIVAQTDLIAVLPKSVAMLFKDAFSLSVHHSSFLHSPQSTSVIFLKAREREPGISWLLNEVRGVFA